MNWGNVHTIKLEPFGQSVESRQIDSDYFFDDHVSNAETSAPCNRKNRKIMQRKVYHYRRNEHVYGDERGAPAKNVQKENYQRYHPYQVKKHEHDDYHHQHLYARNHHKKG